MKIDKATSAFKQKGICAQIDKKASDFPCAFDERQKQINAEKVLARLAEFKPAKAPDCKPLPTQCRLREIFEYDRETGQLICRVKRGGLRVGDVCGTDAQGYVQVFVDHVPYRAHRLIFKLAYGREPVGFLDHKDGNRSNNRLENLREVTPWENSLNRFAPPASASGVYGVYRVPERGKWQVSISIGNRSVHLGYFDNLCCAKVARAHAFGLLINTPANDNTGVLDHG